MDPKGKNILTFKKPAKLWELTFVVDTKIVCGNKLSTMFHIVFKYNITIKYIVFFSEIPACKAVTYNRTFVQMLGLMNV